MVDTTAFILVWKLLYRSKVIWRFYQWEGNDTGFNPGTSINMEINGAIYESIYFLDSLLSRPKIPFPSRQHGTMLLRIETVLPKQRILPIMPLDTIDLPPSVVRKLGIKFRSQEEDAGKLVLTGPMGKRRRHDTVQRRGQGPIRQEAEGVAHIHNGVSGPREDIRPFINSGGPGQQRLQALGLSENDGQRPHVGVCHIADFLAVAAPGEVLEKSDIGGRWLILPVAVLQVIGQTQGLREDGQDALGVIVDLAHERFHQGEVLLKALREL